MPRVGNRHFSYTPQGYAAARKARKQMQAGQGSRTVPGATPPPRPPGASLSPTSSRPPGAPAPARPTNLRQQYKDVKGSKLRERLQSLKGKEEDGGFAPKRQRAILSVLRDRALKNQYGKDFRQKVYGDIEGYKPGLAKKIKASKDQAGEEMKLAKLKSALAEVRERRKSFSPGATYNPKTKQFEKTEVGSKKKKRKSLSVGSSSRLDV